MECWVYYDILALKFDLVSLVDLTLRKTTGHISVAKQMFMLNKKSGCSSPGSVQLTSDLFLTVPKPWLESVLNS